MAIAGDFRPGTGKSFWEGDWLLVNGFNAKMDPIREDGWKYCFYNGDIEELYHFENDSLEVTNLAMHPEYKERKEALKKKLFEQGFVGIGEKVK